MEITISPIGFVHNNFNEISKGKLIRTERSTIALLPEYVEGLYGLKEEEYLEIIFYFHRSSGCQLICQTPHWGTRGVFASRSPFRPAPLGLTKVKLISVNDKEVVVEGLDAVDGTPVLDIKPYVDWSKIKKGDDGPWKKEKIQEES